MFMEKFEKIFLSNLVTISTYGLRPVASRNSLIWCL